MSQLMKGSHQGLPNTIQAPGGPFSLSVANNPSLAASNASLQGIGRLVNTTIDSTCKIKPQAMPNGTLIFDEKTGKLMIKTEDGMQAINETRGRSRPSFERRRWPFRTGRVSQSRWTVSPSTLATPRASRLTLATSTSGSRRSTTSSLSASRSRTRSCTSSTISPLAACAARAESRWRSVFSLSGEARRSMQLSWRPPCRTCTSRLSAIYHSMEASPSARPSGRTPETCHSGRTPSPISRRSSRGTPSYSANQGEPCHKL